MTIPAYSDSAAGFASIAYVISRARELAVMDADGSLREGGGESASIYGTTVRLRQRQARHLVTLAHRAVLIPAAG
jgi:hypothetical protein